MERVFNFSAGPSMLPLEVLEQAQKEFVCYGSSGMSVMEMSHRSKVFEGILEKAQADLRDLMHIPDNYKILFLQGGGSTQFAMIPLNLMNKNNKPRKKRRATAKSTLWLLLPTPLSTTSPNWTNPNLTNMRTISISL